MRDFLNAPDGLSKQSITSNERVESDPSRSPLVGGTVWMLFSPKIYTYVSFSNYHI